MELSVSAHLPVFLAAGHRVVAPDLIGFGKSDKPKRRVPYLRRAPPKVEWIERLDLQRCVLVVGLAAFWPHPLVAPGRFIGLAMNTLLATGSSPPAGFLAWREMCAQKPLFGVGRMLARGNPQ